MFTGSSGAARSWSCEYLAPTFSAVSGLESGLPGSAAQPGQAPGGRLGLRDLGGTRRGKLDF